MHRACTPILALRGQAMQTVLNENTTHCPRNGGTQPDVGMRALPEGS